MLPKTDEKIIKHIESIKNKSLFTDFLNRIQPDVGTFVNNSAENLMTKMVSLFQEFNIDIMGEDIQIFSTLFKNSMSEIWYIEHITRNHLLANKDDNINFKQYFNAVMESDGDYSLFKKSANNVIEINMNTIESEDTSLSQKTIDNYDELEEDFSGLVGKKSD